MKKTAWIAALLSVVSFPALAGDGKVVVSIKPLHSLVAAVMAGDGNEPVLLVDGKSSMHGFSLKPSQAKALENARVVFYIGDGLETFLPKTLASLPAKTQRVAMEKITGQSYLRTRLSDGFEAHSHDHDEAEDDEYGDAYDAYDEEHADEEPAPQVALPRDLHLWLSVNNVREMIKEIARQLSMAYPDKREVYFKNVAKLARRFEALDSLIEGRLQKLPPRKPFIVFHDASQYFEKSYGLNNVGSIMVSTDRAPGAKHLSEIREKIKKSRAACVFREPQFDDRLVANLVAGTGAKTVLIDPEAALLAPGPELYFQMMENMTKSFEECLGS